MSTSEPIKAPKVDWKAELEALGASPRLLYSHSTPTRTTLSAGTSQVFVGWTRGTKKIPPGFYFDMLSYPGEKKYGMGTPAQALQAAIDAMRRQLMPAKLKIEQALAWLGPVPAAPPSIREQVETELKRAADKAACEPAVFHLIAAIRLLNNKG